MNYKHLEDLNPEQYAAVIHRDGPLLIFAGAGSGKTRVLTRRIAHLCLEHKIPADNVLAVTFTNKAATEMKQRVVKLGLRGNPWISTFHSFGSRILRRHAKLLGYSDNFAIYDSNDSVSLMKKILKKNEISSKEISPKAVLSLIDRAKNEYFSLDELRVMKIPRELNRIFSKLYADYQKALLEANAMDFGDLLFNVVSLFKLEPSILARYQNQFKYILIDEYQDTNKVQYILVEMLASSNRNLCVVGDDDQSIYAFRGANINNILNFKKQFPDAVIINLEQNYRSTQTILSAANSIIEQNFYRQAKKMRTDNILGDIIQVYAGFDEKDEAKFVTQEIAVLKERGIRYQDIAVFYRTNAQSRAIEEELCSLGIPYEIFGGFRFYERKEIKDILAYFRLLINLQDNEAFLRIVNTPARGIGQSSLASLIAYADSKGLSLMSALEEAVSSSASFLVGRTLHKYLEFLNLIKELQKKTHEVKLLLAEENNETERKENAIADLLNCIAVQSGYIKNLKKQNTEESLSKIENIYELFRVAIVFCSDAIEQNEKVALNDFLDRTSLSSDLDRESKKDLNAQGYISLMTLHLAKGLEFDAVFMLGMEEGLLPHVRALQEESELEEERRLCYVGVTRAKRNLYLLRAMERTSYGKSSWYSGNPSRFLFDIPEELTRHLRCY